MSEDKSTLFRPDFNRSISVEAVDDSLSANAGAMLLREADHKLAVTEDLGAALCDPRDPNCIRYSTAELLRERLYAFACGYAHQDDADELAHDPAFRAAVWNRAGEAVVQERLGSQSGQSRLLDRLAMPENLETLRRFVGEPVLRHRRVRSDRKVKSATLDIDPFPVTVHGEQEGAAHNGYYGRKVYTPIAAHVSAAGDPDDPRGVSGFLHARLRRGDAAPAAGGLDFMLEAQARASAFCEHVDIRADAAFAHGEILDELTERKIRFVMRIGENAALQAIAAAHASRPAHRPPSFGCEWAFDVGPYRAASWKHAQRLVLVLVDVPGPDGQRKLIPDHFFLVTNWPKPQRDAWDLLAHYRGRGTFEDRFGELNQRLRPRLSSPTFAENEATLLLSFLGYNLAETLRRETELATGSGWDLGRFQRTVLHVGARLAKGSHRLRFLVMRPFARIWKTVADRVARWGDLLARPIPRGRPLVPPPTHAWLSYHPRL